MMGIGDLLSRVAACQDSLRSECCLDKTTQELATPQPAAPTNPLKTWAIGVLRAPSCSASHSLILLAMEVTSLPDDAVPMRLDDRVAALHASLETMLEVIVQRRASECRTRHA
eukprot:3296-Amphidinium_carterae.2